MRKLRRVTRGEWLGGVCGGVAYSCGVSTWVVRLVWFCVIWFYGFGLGAYLLLWIFLPKWKPMPEDYDLVTGG